MGAKRETFTDLVVDDVEYSERGYGSSATRPSSPCRTAPAAAKRDRRARSPVPLPGDRRDPGPDHGDTIGKLFLTSQRVIFAGGASIAWPWHRVRRVSRHERDVLFEGGDTLALRLRCNSYADALAAAAIGERLRHR